jgi:phosphoribosylformylglycinamidine cyclo-ligase
VSATAGEIRHCPLCGSRLVPERIEGRERARCPSCRFVDYQSPAGAAAGVVLDGAGGVLLIRRALEPHRGDWALPAGYQEADETPQRAAEREVREETGLEVEAGALLELCYVPGSGRRPANLAVYLCRWIGGELEPGDDALEARWFPLHALPANVGFDNTRRILERLCADAREAHGTQMENEAAPKASPPAAERPVTYADAGVHIQKKYDAVERARSAIRASYTRGVVGDIGLFGGLFDLGRMGCGEGLLVASADGVGTKLEVAKRAGVYSGVGRDLVQHCINDILVQGARPLFFMDYVAVGRLDPEVVSELIRGCADACRDNGLALLGGETAEMPGLYAPGDFDLAGFIVGIVEREKLLDGSRVRPGQVLLGLRSAGLHTNGYSLARRILFDVARLALTDRPEALGGASVGEALLAEHRSYLAPLWPLLEAGRIAAMAHITGGGLTDNVPRVLGTCDAWIDRRSWEVPRLFRFLCETGRVEREEAYRAFNMGIGMVLFVEPADLPEVEEGLRQAQEEPLRIGRVEKGRGTVRWADLE